MAEPETSTEEVRHESLLCRLSLGTGHRPQFLRGMPVEVAAVRNAQNASPESAASRTVSRLGAPPLSPRPSAKCVCWRMSFDSEQVGCFFFGVYFVVGRPPAVPCARISFERKRAARWLSHAILQPASASAARPRWLGRLRLNGSHHRTADAGCDAGHHSSRRHWLGRPRRRARRRG